jgi:MFS family permease
MARCYTGSGIGPGAASAGRRRSLAGPSTDEPGETAEGPVGHAGPVSRKLAGWLEPSIAALRQVAANPALLRLELGSLAWSTADATYLVGLFVLAYEEGGTAAVAFVAVIRSLPSVVLAPLVMALADRTSRDRLLRVVLAIRVAVVVAATIGVVVGAAPAIIYILGGVDAVGGAVLRPTRATLIPALARSPDELIAANVATTTGDALAALLGPGAAAILLVVGDVAAAFVAGSVVMAIALVAVLQVHAAGALMPRVTPGEGGATRGARRPSPMATARELLALRHARVIVLLFAGQRFVRGMITVALVAAAFDPLGIGDSGVGILTSAIGLGGLLGGAVALALVGRGSLASAFAAGLVAWGGGILASGIVPSVVIVVAFLAIAGIGKSVLDVAGFSLLQRTVPNDRRGRVFGLLEGVIAASLALGPIVAAVLVDSFGAGWALVAAGALPLALVALCWPVLRSADDAAVVPDPQLRLLRGVAMFRPLQLTTIEDLAWRMTKRQVPAGSDVVRQGEPGDTFYIVESGRLATLVDGRQIRELGAGDSFGEIALLRESDRTATVRALEDSRLVALGREPFVAAVTGDPESVTAADDVVERRLAGA